MTRNHTIDALRIIAAFCVVILHVRFYPEYPQAVGAGIRLFGKWAVPFFFLVTGYFLGKKEQNLASKIPSQVVRVIWLFLVWSVVFAVLVFILFGLQPVLTRIFNFSFLAIGTYFHLWFLSSMIVGLLTIYTFYQLGLKQYLPFLTVTILSLALLLGSYNPDGFEKFHFCRHLLSIPFIYLGICISKREQLFGLKMAFLIALGGLVLQGVESYLIYRWWGTNPMDHEFLVGSILMAIGIFYIGVNLSDRSASRLSKIGAEHALGVYLLHPFFTPFVRKFLADGGIENSTITLFIVFPVTLMVLLVLQKLAPGIKGVIDGHKASVQRLAFARTKQPQLRTDSMTKI